jgi:hypothetical protein
LHVTAAVKELLTVIDELPEEDLLELDRALGRRLERQWLAEAERAARAAKRRKIGSAAIDRAIERRRYGR